MQINEIIGECALGPRGRAKADPDTQNIALFSN